MRGKRAELMLWIAVPAAGITCTMIVAFLVACCSPQPTIFTIVNERTASNGRTSWHRMFQPSDSELVWGWVATGFGYTSIDMRYSDTGTSEEITKVSPSKSPHLKRRAFWTRIGWPNAVFATNDRNLGHRFSMELDPNSASNQESLYDGTKWKVKILWSGFFLNSLLFTSFLIILKMSISRHAIRNSSSRSYLISACAGLWLALLSAWSADLVYQAVPFLPRGFTTYEDPNNFDSSVHPIEIPPSMKWGQFSGHVTNAIGYTKSGAYFKSTSPDNRLVADESMLELGWPAGCLRGAPISSWPKAGRSNPNQYKFRHIIALTAMPVWWPGILLNWFFYSIIIVTALLGPNTLRRYLRRFRNQCPKCGYPVGKADPCPECGEPITKAKPIKSPA